MNKVIIDVREPSEFKQGHVPGALNIPPMEIMNGTEQLHGIEKDTQIIVYCLSGARSNATIPYLRQMGFTNITNGINKDHVLRNYFE